MLPRSVTGISTPSLLSDSRLARPSSHVDQTGVPMMSAAVSVAAAVSPARGQPPRVERGPTVDHHWRDARQKAALPQEVARGAAPIEGPRARHWVAHRGLQHVGQRRPIPIRLGGAVVDQRQRAAPQAVRPVPGANRVGDSQRRRVKQLDDVHAVARGEAPLARVEDDSSTSQPRRKRRRSARRDEAEVNPPITVLLAAQPALHRGRVIGAGVVRGRAPRCGRRGERPHREVARRALGDAVRCARGR